VKAAAGERAAAADGGAARADSCTIMAREWARRRYGEKGESSGVVGSITRGAAAGARGAAAIAAEEGLEAQAGVVALMRLAVALVGATGCQAAHVVKDGLWRV